MPNELDRECESTIVAFLTRKHREVRFPIETDDIQCLIERDVDDLDLFADLSPFGSSVEGLTEFRPGHKPRVKISSELAGDPRRRNRLRTTLTHEWGHVHFHAYLWDIEPPRVDLLNRAPDRNRQICKRDTIIDANQSDWMEWQAGYVCGALLMPKTRVTATCAEYFEEQGLYGCATAGSHEAEVLITRVATLFDVSMQAARVRLVKLGLIGTARGPSLFDPR